MEIWAGMGGLWVKNPGGRVGLAGREIRGKGKKILPSVRGKDGDFFF